MADIMQQYDRAQDLFDTTLAALPAQRWDQPTTCPGWTVRDVAGHVVWGQHLVRHWAEGSEYGSAVGSPGAVHPADELDGDDPVAVWRSARSAATAALTPENRQRIAPTRAFGSIPVEQFLGILVVDFLCHAWDIGYPAGRPVVLDDDLITAAWERMQSPLRVPGGIGPELSPPAGADRQTRFLAFLGRRSW
jgi:uncharacterized protein (TIGR03086 family)